MNAPTAPAAFAPSAFKSSELVPLAEFAPSSTRIQARRRARFTKESLAELAASIKAVGVMEPIIARPHPKPAAPIKYEIIAGERRWLAADQAGLVAIPAIVRDVSDVDRVALQLTENLQRETIDQVEEAEGYRELQELKKINADGVAALLGVSRTTVFNRLKLLDLAPEARKFLDEAKISPSVALLVARLPDPKMQLTAAKGCAGDGDALDGFWPDESPEDGPLSYADADKWIKEAFTTRLDGNAAINRAKAAGKPTITGKDAEEIWKRPYAGPAGYVQLSDFYWKQGKKATYASVLGDEPEGTVLIQSPHTGGAEKCLPRKRAIEIFKQKKLTLPSDLQPREVHRSPGSSAPAAKPLTPEARAKQEITHARDLMQGNLDVDIRAAIFKAMRQKYPNKLGKQELLEAIELIDEGGYYRERDLAPEPTSLTKCTERELVHEILDQLYCPDDFGECSGPEKEFLAAAKRYGVNVKKIEKDLTDAAEEKLEEIEAQIKKKAVDAKGAQAKSKAKRAAKGKKK